METQLVERLCMECRAEDCFAPAVAFCQSCQQAREQFMHSPIYLGEVVSDNGQKSLIKVSPNMIFQQVVQPWKSLLSLLCMN